MMKIGIVTVTVTDQEKALHFWTEQVGFEKRMDNRMGPTMRWLTVGAKGQDVELVLWDPTQFMPPEGARQFVENIGKAPSLVMHTDDCKALHAELAGRGVAFLREPTEQPYGVEAVFTDPFGNNFVVTQYKR